MSFSYTYSINDDFPEGAVNATKLHDEITASAIATALEGIKVGGGGDSDRLDIVFESELSSGDKTTLDGDVSNPAGGLIAAHDNSPFGPKDIEYYVNRVAESTDPVTGISGPWDVMQVLQHRKDLYNDVESPLFELGHLPILGEDGLLQDHADQINNLETIHGKLGYHNQQVLQALYARPKDLLIYYGWTNSFNSGANGWDNWKVALDMSRYELIVLGEGIEDDGHGDHSNATTIVGYIKSLNPHTQIFGYVTANQAYENFVSKVDKWSDMGVHGIFIDESGYDFGVTRDQFNDRVDYVHGLASSSSGSSEGAFGPSGLVAFANAWNTDHILGTADDGSYPNSTYNPDEEESHLGVNDWILMESFAVNTLSYTGDYEAKSQWAARGSKLLSLRSTYGVNFAGSTVIQDGHASEQALFDFGYISALMWSLEAFGSSDHNYGSSSAKTKYISRAVDTDGLRTLYSLNPAIRNDVNDNDVYRRFVEHAQMSLDFSSGAEASSFTKE